MKHLIRILTLLLAACLTAGCLAGAVFAAKAPQISVSEKKYEPPTPFGLRALQVNRTGAKLSWDYPYRPNENMGFEVLRYDAGQKKYVHVKYTTKMETTISDLKPNAVCTVRVRAYVKKDGRKLFSQKSEALRFRTSMKAVKLTGLKYVSTGRVRVSWKKNSQASGYLIEYSPSKSFPARQTNRVLVSKTRSSYTVKGLGKQTYYFRITPYRTLNGVRYCGVPSGIKSTAVKKGATLKGKINAVTTDLSGRSAIKALTRNGVDIKKYTTTYTRLREIYRWHAIHAREFESCRACNYSFNACVDALFGDKRKYDDFIWLEADTFRNNDGRRVMHKWSVLYFSGTPYIFDPRMQGNIGQYNGTTYFAIRKGTSAAKPYLHDYWWGSWRDSLTREDLILYK